MDGRPALGRRRLLRVIATVAAGMLVCVPGAAEGNHGALDPTWGGGIGGLGLPPGKVVSRDDDDSRDRESVEGLVPGQAGSVIAVGSATGFGVESGDPFEGRHGITRVYDKEADFFSVRSLRGGPTQGETRAAADVPNQARYVHAGTCFSSAFGLPQRMFVAARFEPTAFQVSRCYDIPQTTVEEANAVVVRPDGRIVAAGEATSSSGARFFALIGLTTRFDLDPLFEGDGIVITAFPGTSNPRIFDLALQPDGRLVAAGTTASSPERIVLARYTASGELDTSFDGDGRVSTPLTMASERAEAVALQPDGKIVVAGSARPASPRGFLLMRYLADGRLDTTFGTNGKVFTRLGDTDALIHDLVIQDGKAVVAGDSSTTPVRFHTRFALARYDSSGRLDETFGTGGIVLTHFADHPLVRGSKVAVANALTIDADGNLLAGGWAEEECCGSANEPEDAHFAIARYHGQRDRARPRGRVRVRDRDLSSVVRRRALRFELRASEAVGGSARATLRTGNGRRGVIGTARIRPSRTLRRNLTITLTRAGHQLLTTRRAATVDVRLTLVDLSGKRGNAGASRVLR